METPVQRLDLAIRLLAHGYTTRAVNFRLQDAGLEPYPEADLVSLRQQHAPEIDDLREREEIETRGRGLARRHERIRRLTLVAEKLEQTIKIDIDPSIPSPDTSKSGAVPLKALAEYRRTLSAIRDEADPLGIAEALDPNDTWVLLITRLTKLRSDPQLPSNLKSATLLESSSPLTRSDLFLPEPEKSSSQEESVQVNRSTPQSS